MEPPLPEYQMPEKSTQEGCLYILCVASWTESGWSFLGKQDAKLDGILMWSSRNTFSVLFCSYERHLREQEHEAIFREHLF